MTEHQPHTGRPLHGEIVRIDEEGSFAFVQTDDGQEYYFSPENMADEPFERLEIGAEVQFLPEVAAEGLHARRVTLSKPGRH